MFKRITIQEAKKRFAEDKPIYLCPCKMNPAGPWGQACLILGKQYLENAEWYQKHPSPLWKGTLAATAWDLMYNNWAFYNTNYEMGYYAHYYIQGKNEI